MRVGAIEAQGLAAVQGMLDRGRLDLAQGMLDRGGGWPWRLSSVAHTDWQVECSVFNIHA